MVIRLVTHGDLLFLDFPPQLSVHPLSHRGGGRHRVVTKDLTQMVEQSGGLRWWSSRVADRNTLGLRV